ncbi:hypothetical protein NDN08_006327 [Rhodosorus marinus]|uniref:Uncharacterized protein n=1 Tax=Rhodosorus marinus TaxID=101924 RepID=A0AAV8UQZ8_9RHOD|nr:hypothetical protein NDN08_006327 [Rhodosorus marinus]
MALRSTLGAFLAGCVVSNALGYFFLHQDVVQANGAVNESVKVLAEKVRTGEELEKRISILEETVKEMQGAK